MAPSQVQIDAWGQLGNAGWSWDILKPYYAKAYTLTPPSDSVREHMRINYIDDTIRGRSGPIQVSFSDDRNLLSKAWVDTFESLGYGLSTDPFSGQAVGGFSNPLTLNPNTKTRSYSTQYHKIAQGRQNLHIKTGVLVQKVILEQKDQEVVATGVQYTENGETCNVNARLEVIIAAGALNSPRVLELSGIGNPDILKSHDIPVMIENPFVGENLQDHLMTGISYRLTDQLPSGVVTLDGMRREEPEALQAAKQAYEMDRSGPLSVGAVLSYSYMPVVDLIKKQAELKQILYPYFNDIKEDFPSQKFQYDFIRTMLEDPNEGTASYFLIPTQGRWDNGPLEGNWLTLGVAFLTPFSRGHVHISSADPTQKPIFNPKYLSHPLDVEFHARHLQYLETIVTTQPLAGLLKAGEVQRGSKSSNVKNDLNRAKNYVKKTVTSNWHVASTCAMMPRELGGVVNNRLIVHGTKNLRVVDSSIMPMIPRANTQSTVYAVAERAADMIKEEHSL